MRRRNRVVITGLGPITTVGIGKDEFWNGLRREESGIGTVTRFDPSPFSCHIAGEISEFEPAKFMDAHRARRLDRYSQFAIAATRLALDNPAP